MVEREREFKNYYWEEKDLEQYKDDKLFKKQDLQQLDGYFGFINRVCEMDEYPDVFNKQRLNIIRNMIEVAKSIWIEQFILLKTQMEHIKHRKIVQNLAKKYIPGKKLELNFGGECLQFREFEYREIYKMLINQPFQVILKRDYYSIPKNNLPGIYLIPRITCIETDYYSVRVVKKKKNVEVELINQQRNQDEKKFEKILKVQIPAKNYNKQCNIQ